MALHRRSTIVIFTDQKPLTPILLASSDRYTPRQVRHLDYISQFTSDIHHVKGVQNRPADALSRLSVNTLATNVSDNTVDFVEMTAAQTDNPDLQWLQSSSSFIFRGMPLPMADGTIVCDISASTPRPYVPASYQCIVFNSLHSLSHQGI